MRRLSISLDIAFGKDEPEVDPDAVAAIGSADTVTERRDSEDHSALVVGFGRSPWEDQ